MKSVLLVTGNERKIWQATDILKAFDVAVEAKDLDITEIQSHDPLAIAQAKAEAAFSLLKQPLVVCDHSWAFHALKGFPGGYMKDVNGWFEPEDFLALMHSKQDRSVTLTETVIFIDEADSRTFSVDYGGKVIHEARGVGSVPCERVVVYDGSDKTIAEHIDAGEHARDMKKSAWHAFGGWYSKQ